VAAISVAGCGFVSWTRVSINDPIRDQDVAFIVPGKTTFQQIQARLGAPSLLSKTNGHMIARYYFLDAKYFRINWGWPLRLVIPYPPDLVMSRAGLAADAFMVVFDAQEVAQSHAFTRHKAAVDYRLWPFDYDPPQDYPVVAF
jgi:hypothetical protein